MKRALYYPVAGLVFVGYVVSLVLVTIGTVGAAFTESWLDALVDWKGR